MTDANPRELGFLPKVILVLGALLITAGLLIAAGAVWYGMTTELLRRFSHDLLDRPQGPLSFRFILQPGMAAIAAIRGGLKDARAGRSPFFATIVDNPEQRIGRLREGLIATARIILLGLIMDAIYQYLVFKTFYPAQALVIALLICFVPYVMIRGPVTRIARRFRGIASGELR